MSNINPKEKIKQWLENAKNKVEGNWNAMCVSTVDENHTPDSRMVLFTPLDQSDDPSHHHLEFQQS